MFAKGIFYNNFLFDKTNVRNMKRNLFQFPSRTTILTIQLLVHCLPGIFTAVCVQTMYVRVYVKRVLLP